MITLTVDHVMRATGANEARARKYLPYIQSVCEDYEINTPRRIAGFLSQIGHESAGFSRLTENLNYSVQALLKQFGRHRISEAKARQFGRAPGQKANQVTIANIIYGGEWGREHLGNTEPGDGWRFRGRGKLQITGRRNYKRCGEALGLLLVEYPERLLVPLHSVRAGGWFWQEHNLNEHADRKDVATMTRIINGGSKGLARRIALFNAGLAVLGEAK